MIKAETGLEKSPEEERGTRDRTDSVWPGFRRNRLLGTSPGAVCVLHAALTLLPVGVSVG